MNLTKKNIQKTSGIHRLGKFYKPGQLVTIDRHVYRITKTNELLTCEHCVNYKHWPSKCRYFGCWGHVPINCYFKLVKLSSVKSTNQDNQLQFVTMYLEL